MLSCVQIVNWLAQYKPKQLSKQGLVKPVLEALCKLCAEPDPEDHDDEDQLSASKFASQVRCKLSNMTFAQHCVAVPFNSEVLFSFDQLYARKFAST